MATKEQLTSENQTEDKKAIKKSNNIYLQCIYKFITTIDILQGHYFSTSLLKIWSSIAQVSLFCQRKKS